MMATGKTHHQFDMFLVEQEDAWERTARILAMQHNTGILISRSFGGGTIDRNDLKDADDLNAWLNIDGDDGPGHVDSRSQAAFDFAREKERQKREAVKRG